MIKHKSLLFAFLLALVATWPNTGCGIAATSAVPTSESTQNPTSGFSQNTVTPTATPGVQESVTLEPTEISPLAASEDGPVPTFDNIVDAEAAAGFGIYVPRFIPEGFERGPITVRARGGDSDRVVVSQQWTSREERSNLRINQSRRTKLSGADKQSVIIRGQPGERLSGPASGGRPGELSILHWIEEGEMSITVIGFLTGSVSEDTLMQIAESLQR